MERRERRAAKSKREFEALMPKNRSYSSKKRHAGEPLEEFKDRRKKANRRKRKSLLYKKF